MVVKNRVYVILIFVVKFIIDNIDSSIVLIIFGLDLEFGFLFHSIWK